MTVQEAAYSKPSFEVWARLGETFSVLGRRPWVFFGFTFVVGILVPLAAVVGSAYLTLQSTVVLNAAGDHFEALFDAIFIIVIALTQLILLGVLTLCAHDSCVGTKRPVRAYVDLAWRRTIVLLLVLAPLSIIVGIGFAITGLLGIWATAVYSAILPIIVVEKLGFRSIGRARLLSKGYRWPIVGYIAILLLIFISLLAAVTTAAVATSDDMAIIILPLVMLLFAPVSTALACIASATIYVRLRAIKEGSGLAEIADVFA